jgi:molecular chaperone DnaK
MSLAIGIDFGTSNSNAAVWNGRNAEIIEMPDGRKSMPSAVYLTADRYFVGAEAMEKGRADRKHLFRHFKRNLGERFDEATASGYQNAADENGLVGWVAPDGKVFTSVMLASFVIEELLDAAEAKLGKRPTIAVVTIPADATEAQEAATIEAAELAGLETVRLMREPTAAALAYGFDFAKPRRIAVIDHGGGTFDISIIQTGKGRNDHSLVEVKATDGRRRGLGGMDVDKLIASYLGKVWRTLPAHNEIELSDTAMARILEQAEAAKIKLSRSNEAEVHVPGIASDKEGVSLDMNETITLPLLKDLTSRISESISAICKRAVDKVREKDPNFSIRDINDVVLVGGMTRSPIVRDAVREVFGKEPRKDINPEEAVAMGAAIEAARLAGAKSGLTVRDITARNIAVETIDGVASVIVPAGTSFPCDPISVTIRNARDGQQALSIAILEGNGLMADGYEVIGAHDHIISEPGPSQAAGLKLKYWLDDSGRFQAETEDGWAFRGAA